MFSKLKFIGLSAFFALQANTAFAHPSPNILQAGGAKGDRVAFTGINYKSEKGVGIYRGRTALLGDDPAPSSSERKEIEIILTEHTNTCHKPARLRTQGFYSGKGRTRPFTQGFYSGQRTVVRR